MSGMILVAAAIIFLIPINSLIAKDKATVKFVDLDGDGFNDTQAGTIQEIVDEVSPDSPAQAIFDIGAGLLDIPEIGHSNSAGFDALSFSARALKINRCSMESDAGFGPGNGIGSGILSSGCCEGGVCRPY